MSVAETRVRVSEIPVADAPAIRGVQVMTISDEPVIVYSTTKKDDAGFPTVLTRLTAVAPDRPGRDPQAIFAIRQLLPPSPRWHGRVDGAEVRWVYELAGGALNALIVQARDAAPQAVSGAHPLESFSLPSFVGGDVAWGVTAVADGGSLVLFAPDRQGRYGRYRRLADGVAGRVAATGAGTSVVRKIGVPGPSCRSAPPGVLDALFLDAEFRERRPSLRLAADAAYEFDVAWRMPERFMIATTVDGPILAAWRDEDSAARQSALIGDGLVATAPTAYPSICATNTELLMAAVQNPETGDARLLFARVSLDEVHGRHP